MGSHAAPPSEARSSPDSSECSGDCSACATEDKCQTEQEREYRLQQRRLEERAARMRHQILVLSGKGGVGKSTVAANLAWLLAAGGYEVGLLDADLHGPTIPLMLGVSHERALGGPDGLTPVPALPALHVMSMGFLLPDSTAPIIWRGPLRANALRQLIADVNWPDLDFLIVDLPPGTGDEPLTIGQAFPRADGAVIVTTPQEASLSDCRKAINFVRALGLRPLGVIENMSGFVCPHCGRETDIFSQGGGQRMAEEMDVPFLGRVPLVPEVVALADEGVPMVGARAPTAAREAFSAVARALRQQLTPDPALDRLLE